MSTNNGFLTSIGDLSSFEPEAILAVIPGEHPRMAAGLHVGRQASQSGQLDVAALTRIATELYAEDFSAGASFTATADFVPTQELSIPKEGAFLSTDNLFTSQPLGNQLIAAYPLDTELQMATIVDPYHVTLNTLIEHLDSDALQTDAEVKRAGSTYYFVQAPEHVPVVGALDAPITVATQPSFDANLVRKDFPILRELINGRPLVWFDNAATTHKPQAVIDRIAYFYAHENSNIHRAAHALAARATDAYEGARETVRRFINAPSVDNVVFVRGTTEAINLVAKSWGKKHLGEGDEIVISHLEHHANIVPWQQLCQETGAKLKVAPVDDSGQVLLAEYQKLLTSRVKLVSFTQVSNALGTVTPAAEMIQMAHQVGAKVLLDGAQSVSHMRTDVQALNPDFFVFSGHKVFGPTGIGVLYGTKEVLNDMPAWQGGGNMIQDVTFDKTVYHEAPAKFEAGTGNIADAVGLGAALEYVERIGIDQIARYEHALLDYATAAMRKVPGLHLVGTAKEKASVLSFKLDGFKSEDVGAALNQAGIAVRSGHHCAQPILRRFGLETTVRPSLAFYNTPAEVDSMVAVLLRLAAQTPPTA